MNLRVKLFIIFLLNTFSVVSIAQITTSKGYIITNNNDTIRGQLEYSYTGFRNKCVFIKENSTKIEVLKPDQIKEFFISPNIYFRAIEFNGERAFFQILTENKITLYNHDSNLFISCKSDSLIQLKGGKESFTTSTGKSYSQEIEIFKNQLKYCIADASFYPRIENLKFDKKPIVQLVKDFNMEKAPSGLVTENKRLININHFSFESGLSVNNYSTKNIPYPSDTLSVSINGSKPMESASSSIKHQTNSFMVGLNYRRKIAKTNGYLSIGLKYDQMSKMQNQEQFSLHDGFMVPSNSEPYFATTIGKVTDTYNYHLNSLQLPVSYYNEISYGKFRPFYNLGITGKYFTKKDFKLNRKVFLNEKLVDEKNIALKIPSLLLGAKLGFGLRYLINSYNSLSAVVNIELYPKSWFNQSNLSALFNKQFYISYNF